MEVQFAQSWRINEDTGFKAMTGFVALTNDSLVTFRVKGKQGEVARRAAHGELSAKHAAVLSQLLEGGKVKKLRRVPRLDVVSAGMIADAKQLTFATADGTQHVAKGFAFPDELKRVADQLSFALFGDVPQRGRVLSAATPGLRSAAMGWLGGGLIFGLALVVVNLLSGDEPATGRRRWLEELMSSMSLGAAITIAVILVLGGAAVSFSKFRKGYRVFERRISEH